jgi:hypothetical protein
MTAIRRTLTVLLLAAIPAAAAHAAPARASNPFSDLDSIDLSIEIGGPLDHEGNLERELLAGELRRFNVLQSGLRRALVTQVESCGLLVDQGATDEISVEVFGRPEPPQEGGPPQYVFLVEIGAASRVSDAELAPRKRVLGLADDSSFEAAVIDAALAALPDDLRYCEDL